MNYQSFTLTCSHIKKYISMETKLLELIILYDCLECLENNYLKSVIMWKVNIVTRFVQVQNTLEDNETCLPVANNSKQTLIELCHHCKSSKHPIANDLLSIFTKLHFKVSYKLIKLYLFICTIIFCLGSFGNT